MSRPANVATGKCRDRQMSRPANVATGRISVGKCRDRQMSRPANVATGKCRDRQMSANVAIGKSPTLNSTLSPFSQNGQSVRMQTMQHNAELTFQAQPVDLFFYRQAMKHCITTLENEKQQSFPFPFFLYYTAEWLSECLRSSTLCQYVKHDAFSLSLSML